MTSTLSLKGPRQSSIPGLSLPKSLLSLLLVPIISLLIHFCYASRVHYGRIRGTCLHLDAHNLMQMMMKSKSKPTYIFLLNRNHMGEYQGSLMNKVSYSSTVIEPCLRISNSLALLSLTHRYKSLHEHLLEFLLCYLWGIRVSATLPCDPPWICFPLQLVCYHLHLPEARAPHSCACFLWLFNKPLRILIHVFTREYRKSKLQEIR